MELYRLHCFQVVVEEGGVKRATSRLHITQPALSYQIKQLEHEVGAQLLHRLPGGVRPTEAGRVLFRQAQEIDGTLREAREAIKALANAATGEVRIGTIHCVGIYLLPRIIWRMRHLAPTLRATVVYREADEIIEELLANKLDFGLLVDPPTHRRLHYELLLEDPISLVTSTSHPLGKSLTVDPGRLGDTPLITLSSGKPTGRLVRNYLRDNGVASEPTASIDDVESIKRMVELGMGAAFLPDMVTEGEIAGPGNPDGRLCRLRLNPSLARRVYLVTWKDGAIPRADTTFIEALRAHVQRKTSVD